MYMYEPVMFHKAYPLDSFLEEARIMEKERELMLSYLPKEYQEMQRKVEETCDQMEYQGSRMYDEHPDGGAIRQMARKIMDELRIMPQEDRWDEFQKEQNVGQDCMDGSCQPARYQEDIICCFLCNEMFRRRYRTWRSKRYIK